MVSASIASGLRREIELSLMWIGGGLLLVGLWLLLIAGQIHLLCALMFVLPLLLLAVYDKESAVVWTVVYLILLGDIRRVVSDIAAPATFDSLLLVVPMVTAVLVAPSLLS